MVDIETITITDKFVGFVRYKDGFKLYVGACDSHFVAFNTDKPIRQKKSYAPYRAKILFVQSLKACDFSKRVKNKSLRR